MNRAERIHKLANAIRRYRGAKATTADDCKWRTPPNAKAKDDIYRWLARLQLPIVESMARIDSFKTVAEFNAWLRLIEC